MSTIIDFRPTQSRQAPVFRAEHPERVTVEALLAAVIQPVFSQNPALTNVEFKLRDPSRSDERLGEDILSTAVNDVKVAASEKGKAVVHPLEIRGHSVRLADASPATESQDTPVQTLGAPVIQFRRRETPQFDPYTPPPTAA
jgi:predicted MarR family transcription regulator